MNTYAWPASVTTTRNEIVLTFPDWPDLSESGASIQEAIIHATDALSAAVSTRIETRAPIPIPSDRGPRQIPILIDAETAANLDSYLEEREIRSVRQANELQQAYNNRRTAFLTEFRANVEPIERIIERADGGAKEYASIGIRFCYILNAGGLVVIPAILEILGGSESEKYELIYPACAFVAGVILAALTNYLAYLSTIKAGEAWSHESNARAKECSGIYYPPDDQTIHEGEIAQERINHELKLNFAQILANLGIGAFTGSILAFLAGVGSAILGIW